MEKDGDGVLFAISAFAFVVIVGTLGWSAVEFIGAAQVPIYRSTPNSTGLYRHLRDLFGAFVLIYGVLFAPSIIVASMYARYVRGRWHGRLKSYGLEFSTIFTAALTLYVFFLIEGQ